MPSSEICALSFFYSLFMELSYVDYYRFTEQLVKRRRISPDSITSDETSRAWINQYQV